MLYDKFNSRNLLQIFAETDFAIRTAHKLMQFIQFLA